MIERRCGAWEYAVEPLCAAKSTEIPPFFFSPAAGYFSFPFSLEDYQGRPQTRSCDCTIGTTVTCVLDTHGRGRVRFPRSTIVTLDICMVTTVLQKRARAHINTNGIIYQYRQWHMATSVNDLFTTMVMATVCPPRHDVCRVIGALSNQHFPNSIRKASDIRKHTRPKGAEKIGSQPSKI